MDRYDIAIVGTGPAGLEAAITAKIRNKKILLIGKRELSLKIKKAHTISNYLGLLEISGEELQNKFAKHLELMNIDITEDKINTVYAMGQYFALQGHSGMYEASSVILACGISPTQMLPGEIENLGRGVSYCATCDAALYRGRDTIVIGYSRNEEAEAEFLSEIAAKVVYIPMYQDEVKLNEKIQVLRNVTVTGIEKVEKKIVLRLDNKRLETDGLFILRESVAPYQLVPGLEIENNQVVVDRGMRTNISGLFACGDITGAPYQYIKAAGEGNVAALSAVNFLADNKSE